MSKTRVIIIEQQKVILEHLSELLNDYSNIEIVGMVSCRNEGINLIESLQPDLALIDIYFIKNSDWKSTPINSLPVLILANPFADEVAETLRAISSGAIDFINKKELNEDRFKEELTSKINKAIKRINNKQFNTPNANQPNDTPSYDAETNQNIVINKVEKNKHHQTVIAIGTSTGGPKALQNVLEKLPANISAPIFIVQHMPSGFTKSLANRLNYSTDLKIKEAVNNEVAQNGTVYIAPGNYHMTVSKKGNQIRTYVNQGDSEQGHRPSVDVLFKSIATLDQVNKVAVILTGMGKDGAEGVRAIKEQDQSACIIAESKKSAVIFGMPQAAVATECVTNIAHLDDIGTMIKDYVER